MHDNYLTHASYHEEIIPITAFKYLNRTVTVEFPRIWRIMLLWTGHAVCDGFISAFLIRKGTLHRHTIIGRDLSFQNCKL